MKVRVGFGFGTTAAGGLDGARWLETIDSLERLRWDSVWFSERISLGVPDPLALMAAVAARTTRLKFGPSVLVVPGRNPVLLAKELATIDQLSGGRLVVAFGLGAPIPSEHELFGVRRDERAGRTDEAVALIKRLWTEDDVVSDGPFYPVHGLTLRPRPAQRPHPDVWFGGHSAPALRRTGRLGDGWLPSFVTPEEYKPKADAVREAAAQAGREIDEEHFGALVAYVPEDADGDASSIVAAFRARRPDVAAEDVMVLEGRRALRERLERFIDHGASKFVVVPLIPPRAWETELAELRDDVAIPLET